MKVSPKTVSRWAKETPGRRARGGCLDGDLLDHLDTVRVKLLAEQLAELDVDGGHDRGSPLDLSLTVRPRAVNASAIPKLM